MDPDVEHHKAAFNCLNLLETITVAVNGPTTKLLLLKMCESACNCLQFE